LDGWWRRVESVEKVEDEEDEEALLEKARLKRLAILNKFSVRYVVAFRVPCWISIQIHSVL
jgi:hypothetical protein